MFDIDRLRQGLDAKAKMTNESINKIANKMSSSVQPNFGSTQEFGGACAFLCSAHAGLYCWSKPATRWRVIRKFFLE